nr:hypothetical protein [Desulfobacterales bacterium]
MMKRILLLSVFFLLFYSGGVFAKTESVSVDKANIRTGPGKEYEVIWQVGKYYPVKVIKKSGEWYKIRDFEDDEGWIHSSLLKKIPSVVVKRDEINVRKGPGKEFKILFRAEKGVSFKLLKKKGMWVKVQHADGDVGWIYRPLVWGLED